MERDGLNQSIWQTTEQYKPQSVASLDEVFDVTIIGGGITGITTALLLQTAGKKCLLTEARTLGFGTTGGTTAHLNTFFDTPYNTVSKNFNQQKATLLAQGAKAAISLVKSNVNSYNIDCDFKEMDGYVFAVAKEQDKELQDIVEGCEKAQVKAHITNNSAFPIPYTSVALFESQAQFNPAKYIFGLAEQFEKAGGTIIENNRANSIDDSNEILQVQTEQGSVKTRQVVYATHIPPGINLLHLRCAPYRSYAIAVSLNSDEYPMAMGYDLNDPYHYYRTQNIGDKNYLIVGGEDHKTGHEENTEACFNRLESHVRTYFDVKEVAFRWSSQYYEPADGVAYIGNLPGNNENVFVATGFGGNGMIYGTLSAIVLSNIIGAGQSIYEDLFDPNRLKPVAGFTNFVKENTDVVARFLKDRFTPSKLEAAADMAPGEGRIVKHDGENIAVYKDELHELHIVNPVCTHMKCIVAWNATEKSWDCPCHGARFSIDGDVLCGPAPAGLEKLKPEAITEDN